MAEIEEMKIENDCKSQIDEIRVNNRVYLTKVFLEVVTIILSSYLEMMHLYT